MQSDVGISLQELVMRLPRPLRGLALTKINNVDQAVVNATARQINLDN